MKIFLLLFISFSLCISILGQSFSSKREFRGVWAATFSYVNWPTKTQTPQQQRNAFIALIDQHKATDINLPYIQIRGLSGGMYTTTLEPCLANLTGAQEVTPNPFWDPMQFMIEECHKIGMEFHAWINPYRAIDNSMNSFSANYVTRKYQEWWLAADNLKALDPGLQEIQIL
jgi:uncharacterized lipoprotein YddW (UPF0748 family)